jgi:NAD(P)-dependent dehydrogenase (short-subunit alcohol dehydrogenase family)
VVCDFAHGIQPEDWLPRLTNIDVVVNCAGILREVKDQTFDAVHRAAPSALFDACTQADVKRVVQVSALGRPEGGGFISSKHATEKHYLPGTTN